MTTRRSGARTAWIFLTRVPLGDDPDPDIARAVPWLPIIGAVIGTIAGGLFAGASELLPGMPAAALAVTGAALVTGAFHHDGLADMADAFGGGWDKEQRLRILKDSRHGTYGVMALVCIVLVQVSSLATLGPAQGFAALVGAHALGRAGAVALLGIAPAATGDGLGSEFADSVTARAVAVGVLGGVLIGAAALGLWLPLAAAAVGVGVLACGVLAWRKIGGVSGDVLGAAEQIGETAVLLVAAVLARRGISFPR